ncbi:MAG: FG-GAP repeat protein [Alphaproteobacteria bacterium]|nr:FG-GAP repeat protein [Alphaproteobacteria bacterium]
MFSTLLLTLVLACTDKSEPTDDSAPVTTDDSADADVDGDGYAAPDDCDDGDAAVHPDAPERCDGVDNDCDGEVDEDPTDPSTWYADDDGDGYGDPEDFTEACEAPEDTVAEAGDCDDRDEDVHPGAAELCDDEDNDCDGAVDEDASDQPTWYRDSDGDGYGTDEDAVTACEAPTGYVDAGGDCDDADTAYRPGAPENDCTDPNDYNCDGATGYDDLDADGWAACEECDDTDAAINPDAAEVCDGVDNDCDGRADDADSDVDPSSGSTYYADADGDTYGDPSASLQACAQPSGYVTNDDDCDDTSASNAPGEDEYCDGVDNDCDGTADEPDAVDVSTWYADADGDGYGDTNLPRQACDQPTNYVLTDGDCDDAEPLSNPGEVEVCDALDNDCDGTVDNDDAADALTWYADADSDGYGDPNGSATACSQPSGYVADDTDCDDAQALSNPGEIEVCDTLDNDCDGTVDNDTAVDASTWYADADGDGYGDPDDDTTACDQPSGYVSDNTDCDDAEATTYPGATDPWYDGVDSDCAEDSDFDQDGDGFDSDQYGGDDCEDTDATRYPGGNTWQVPADFTLIQDAIDYACTQDTVEVAAGTYSETLDLGTKALNLVGTSGAASTILDAGFAGTALTVSNGAVEGFTITGGAADDGGGVSVTDATDLALTDLIIVDNLAVDDGGGVYLLDSSGVVFTDVDVFDNGAGRYGGGIAIEGDGGVSMSSVTIIGNFTASSGRGGGIYGVADATEGLGLNLEDVYVDGNTCEGRGGGVYLEDVSLGWTGGSVSDNDGGDSADGGGLYILRGLFALDDVQVDRNLASDFGGVYALNTAGSFTGSTLNDNVAVGGGGGIYCRASTCDFYDVEVIGNYGDSNYSGVRVAGAGSTFEVVGLTVMDNHSSNASSHAAYFNGDGTLENLVVAGNEDAGLYVFPDATSSSIAVTNATVVGNAGDGVTTRPVWVGQLDVINTVSAFNDGYGLRHVTTGYNPTLEYNDVYGNSEGAYVDITDPSGTSGNLAADPLLMRYTDAIAPTRWDLHPSASSPLVDAGDPALSDPDSSTSDIGAFGGPSAPAGYNDDGDSDGLPDGWEALVGLDTAVDDSADDGDGDGLTNAEELAAGTDPGDADTDGDTVSDGDELALGTDPLVRDPVGDVVIDGPTSNDNLGYSVSAGGDLNGDGQADLIVGAYGSTEVFALYGPVTSSAVVTALAAATLDDTRFGYVVAGGGDVNDDGFDDILVSNYAGAGTAYVCYGPVSGSLDASGADVSLTGQVSGDAAGSALALSGDGDADGVADLLIGAPTEDTAASNAGAVYLVYGPPTSGGLGSADAKITGIASNDRAGTSADWAGDLNGDGADDVVIGAPQSDTGGSNNGSVYVLLSPLAGTVGLAAADGAWAGDESNSRVGTRVAGAGDLDGDGYADLIMGGYGARGDTGVVYVVLGPATGSQSLADADGKLFGESIDSSAGDAVDGAGDLDGDGQDDVVIGAWEHDDGQGAAYLVYGPATGTRSLIDADAVWVGSDPGVRFGWSVAGVGDLNNDGFPDVAVGSPEADGTASNAGMLTVLFGGF